MRHWLGRRALVVAGLAMTLVLVGFGSLVAVNAMARQTVQEAHSYAFRGSSVSIELSVGEVHIVPSSKDDQISVRRVLTYGLRRPFVEEKIEGDKFRVRDGNCAVPLGSICHVRWLIEIPRSLPVDVTTDAGGIRVSGLSGPVKLTSTSGTVQASTLSGTAIQLLSHEGKVTGRDLRSDYVVATSRTGEISLTFSTHPRLVQAQSVTGAVGVVLPPEEEPYRITARAGGSRSIPATSDPHAERSITVRSDTNDVSVIQSPAEN